MERGVELFNYKNTTVQRNGLALSSLLLLTVIVVQSLFLFSKQERVVLIPCGMMKESWIESSKVSPDYLQQWAAFLSNLLLSKSYADYEERARSLIPYIDPSLVHQLLSNLQKEGEGLKKNHASYEFHASSLKTDRDDLSVEIQGWMIIFVEGKEVSRRLEKYVLSFRCDLGRLILTSLRGGSEHA
jgi:type IV conjugative transfer system protein TraE